MSFLSLWLASLLGSPHCLGMCGGLVSYVSNQPGSRWMNQAFYHSGRILIYMIFGFLAGWFGENLNSLGWLLGIQSLSPLLVAIFLFTQSILLFLGKAKLELPIFKPLHERVMKLWPRLRAFPLGLGILTGFLPCGWLYSFVVLSMSASSVWKSVGMMFVFGLGTLPILVVFGASLRKLLERTGLAPLKITAGLLFLAALFSLSQHLGYFSPKSHSHHEHSH